MRALGHALLVLSTVLPGCLGADDEGGTSARVFPVEDTWEDCDFAAIGFLHEKEALREVLPPGWEPRDAQALFGTPQPTGRGLAAVFVGTCAHVGLAGGPLQAVDVFVMVEAPTLVGADPGPAFRDFYLPLEYADSEAFLAFLAETGYNGTSATLDISFTFAPDVASMAATVSDERGEVMALASAIAPGATFDQSTGSRFWQEVDGGVAFYEISFPQTLFHVGALTTCRTRPGSIPNQVLGAEDCTLDESFVFTAPGADFPYSFHFLSGAFVEA